MVDIEIEERETIRKTFHGYCPICNKEISGNSRSQVNYAMNTHIKHKHEDEKTNY